MSRNGLTLHQRTHGVRNGMPSWSIQVGMEGSMVSDRFVARLVRSREKQYVLAASVGISPARLSRLVHGEPLTASDRHAVEQIAARLGLAAEDAIVE